MKKTFVFILFLTLFFLPQSAMSQSEDGAEKIDLIKEKVTSKVAELDLVEKRVIVGTVEKVKDNQININDLNNKTRIIEVDEITKYSSADTPNFNITDIDEGSKLSIVGLYNKDSEKLLGRFVNEISIPVFLSGVISEKDEDEFTVSITTEEENEFIVDVETITKSYSFLDGDLENSGFSDFELLQNTIIIGFKDPKEENRYSATKIIVFPDTPSNPNIKVELPTPTEVASPSPSTIEE